MSIELSVILPAYKEEENLKILLPRLTGVLSGLGLEFEVIIVDTMEPMDRTKEVCAEFSEVRYLPRIGGNTYGDAIRSGIEASKGKRVVFMDADGSHDPEFIQKLLEHKDSADVVIASRYIDGGKTENSPLLILMSRMVNLGYAIVLNIRCKDVSNSFKLYHGNQLRALTLGCNNFDVVEEILYKLGKTNKSLRIQEIPFTFKQRLHGETKRDLLAFIFTYVITLFKLRFMSHSHQAPGGKVNGSQET